MKVVKLIMVILILWSLVFFNSPVYAVDYCADANCQGCWLMDVDEDPLSDSSGSGSTAALKGAGEPNYSTASLPAAYVTGKYMFDGTDDYALVTADANDIDLVGGVNYSIVGWFYPETNLAISGMVGKKDDGNDQWFLLYRSSQAFVLASDDGTTKIEFGTGNYPKDNWYHVAVVKESGVGYFFRVDKVNDGTNADNNSCANDHNLALGEDVTNSQHFQGQMTEVAVFDRALTTAEIDDIYDNGLVQATTRRIMGVY